MVSALQPVVEELMFAQLIQQVLISSKSPYLRITMIMNSWLKPFQKLRPQLSQFN